MQSVLSPRQQKSHNCSPSAPCALWPVDLRLTHLDWNPEATLIHFQGQYLSICELDYNILQGEIQNIPKSKAAVNIGEFCLVEDSASARWYRGRVQNRKKDLFDIFLIDHGNVLTVDSAHISSGSSDLFILPPKIVCGFLANVLLLQSCSHCVVEEYLAHLVGRSVTGYIQALLPHKVLLLEASDINFDLVRHGFGRHVDTDTFLLLVEMLTEVPLKQNSEPVPDLLIEKPRGQEFSFKSSGLQGYEDILSFWGPRLSCGTKARVRVTAAVNPGLFYCQKVSVKSNLLEMSKKLAGVCEYRTKEHNQKTQENLGLLCSVKGKDEKWYRGFVQFLPVNSQVRVLFIDYGFYEFVKVEKVHRLPDEFYSTPIMAFPCMLSSLGDEDEAVKTQLSFLKAGLLGRVLDVEITSFDELQHLYSITVAGAEDNHVEEPWPIQELPGVKVQSVFETAILPPQSGFSCYETTMSEALDETLKAEEIQVDSVFVGYVEHVQNPNNFWIRTVKRNEEFEEMMKNMEDHFSEIKLEEDVLKNPTPGTLCCAVHEEDMHFYRGVVTDTLEHGAEVLFIDFGNTEKVPDMLIKKIPEAFASKSAFAICCSLVNVFPLDEVWTGVNSNFFKQAVLHKPLLVHIVQMKRHKFVVNLYEQGSDDNNQSISELLISSKHAQYWNNIPVEPIVQNATDLTKKTGYPKGCAISGGTEQQEEWEDAYNNETASKCLQVFSTKPGCDFAVSCSYVDSPSDFWCQPLDKVPELDELMERIQHFYSTHTVPLRSGDSYCVAKSPQDGKWYRAVIAERKGGQACVMSVDYGFTIQLRDSNLQAIIPGYVHLEGQAFRCSLYNLIEPVDSKNCGDWSLEVCKTLKDFILDNTGCLRCKVVSQLNLNNKGLCNVIDLYNNQTQQSINSLLLERGLAKEVTNSAKLQPTVFPETFVYSSFDVRPGNEERVYITHVNSQLEVFCHLDRNTEIIDELEMKISAESEKMIQGSAEAVVPKLCLAKYLDGKWYRGVASPVQSPLHLSVFFVDYGNTTISEKTQVLFMPRGSADLLYMPMQALRCSLAAVSSKELYSDVKEWLTGVMLNKQLRAVILGKNADGSINVELFDEDVNINEKVNELILLHSPKPNVGGSVNMSNTKTSHKSLQGRVRNTSVKCRSRCEARSSSTPTSNAHRGTRVRSRLHNKKENTGVHGKAQTKSTKVKLENGDNSKSSVHVKTQKQSQREQQAELADTNTGKPQQTEDAKIPQLSCLPDMRVSAGFRAKCFVSHVDSMDSFFLQLPEDEPAILKMGVDLSSESVKDSLRTVTSLLQINDLVLAEYEEDGALYRAAVKDREGSSRFRVEFVDYGNSAVIGKEKIYSIPEGFLSQPRFSLPCSLLDTGAYENDASFTDSVMEKPLMVDFVSQRGTHWKVKVEIVGEAGPNAVTHKAAAESSTESEKKEEAPVSSSEVEDVSENEAAKSEANMPTVVGENMLKSQPAASKLKVIIYKRRKTAYTRRIKKKRTPVTAKMECTDTLVRQITKSLQRSEELVSPPAENEEAERQSSLQPEPPRQLGFAPVDMDRAYPGMAAAVTTPSEFCVVREDLLLVMLNTLSILLDDLPSQMTPLPGAHIAPGTCCLLKSQSKKKWCRAEIIRVDTTAVLNLVDYGHSECIAYEDCSKLKCLPEGVTDLPKVTYPCVLRGVKPVGADGQWSDEAAQLFQQCLYQKDLQIFFREFVSNTQWKVDILADGIHVAKYLVDAGHASDIDIMLGLRFQEQSPCKAPCPSPESEEECDQEDEGSDRKSELSFESADEAEEKMPVSVESGLRQCFLM